MRKGIFSRFESYLYANAISRVFYKLARQSSLFIFDYRITEFPADKPLELAHSIFQIEYHLLIHMDIVSIKRYHDFFV